ncbi:hypothetical protein GCM10023335_20620 [Streptomyces siamensis]|uniref:Uncharacterized protein n=2 Tax=Streptomyces TaxID=1883 RepID=A0ABP9INS3_9ACTN
MLMVERSVIVRPPADPRGREVVVDGESMGIAYGLRDLATFLRSAGWAGLDEIDVADSPFIEWHGGGPEVWAQRP